MIETAGFVEPEPHGQAQYVQSVWLNGESLDRTWITGNELHGGGRLLFELGPEPGAWGKSVRPPSTALGAHAAPDALPSP